MNSSLVMTIIGEDRPGLVDSVAALIVEHGGNWLESRMSRLGGQFAGILRVAVPEEREDSLVSALRNLRTVTIVVQTDQAKVEGATQTLWVLEIVGQDRPGIIREISRVLAQRHVNVESLETECASAAMSGEPVFKARALVQIPASCNLEELRRELEKIGHDLIVDVALGAVAAQTS